MRLIITQSFSKLRNLLFIALDTGKLLPRLSLLPPPSLSLSLHQSGQDVCESKCCWFWFPVPLRALALIVPGVCVCAYADRVRYRNSKLDLGQIFAAGAFRHLLPLAHPPLPWRIQYLLINYLLFWCEIKTPLPEVREFGGWRPNLCQISQRTKQVCSAWGADGWRPFFLSNVLRRYWRFIFNLHQKETPPYRSVCSAVCLGCLFFWGGNWLFSFPLSRLPYSVNICSIDGNAK